MPYFHLLPCLRRTVVNDTKGSFAVVEKFRPKTISHDENYRGQKTDSIWVFSEVS